MTVGYSAMTSAHLPAWLAKETGIFAKNGLDVQLVYVRAGTTVVMALLSNQSQISQVGGSSIVGASLRGGRCGDDRWGDRDLGVLAHESARY
jgi:ABC-type nitrate/sulfonate/bicarbonate transport system substrate-binding protein